MQPCVCGCQCRQCVYVFVPAAGSLRRVLAGLLTCLHPSHSSSLALARSPTRWFTQAPMFRPLSVTLLQLPAVLRGGREGVCVTCEDIHLRSAPSFLLRRPCITQPRAATSLDTLDRVAASSLAAGGMWRYGCPRVLRSSPTDRRDHVCAVWTVSKRTAQGSVSKRAVTDSHGCCHVG